MLFWKAIFFIGIFIVLYNYVFYALLIYVFNKLFPHKETPKQADYYPTVSFIVAAYNEAQIIEKKIQNSLQQGYPLSKVEFIFITDGSTDSSPEIIKRYPEVILLHKEKRQGKSAALNRAVFAAKNEILIISDANTFLNEEAIRFIAMHYADKSVGGVAGEKRVIESPEDIGNVGKREGLYWRYESLLKKIDSDFYSVVGAAGELFSVRRDLYETLPDSTILDDFVVSLKAAAKGFKIVYEPNACATEFASVSIEDEKKRKVRISAGGFQSIQMLAGLFKFWKHPKLTFLYISHRILRWTLSPLSLVLILISNIIIVAGTKNSFYIFCLICQLLFYFIAFISIYIPGNSKLKPLKFTGYFVFMNVSVFQGFYRYVFGKQDAAWEKVSRTPSAIVADK